MSEFETTGLSITLFKPTITVNTATTPYSATWIPEGAYLGSYTAEVTSYQHTIQAVGGYESATFTLVCSLSDLENWVQQGLGLHVRVADAANIVVWEGFVDSLAVSVGSMALSLGPLTEIGNQVTAIYALEDTSVRPPTSGVRTRTATQEHLISETKYGLFPKVLAIGAATAAEAAYVRDLWCLENALPTTTKQIAMGMGAGEILLTFKCSGYYALLNYPYNQLPNTGTINLSTKIGAILTAAPNALFSVANSSINANALQVPAYEGDDQEGWSIIKDLVTHGDASSLYRYTCGVYADRRVVYTVVDWIITYHSRLFDPLQQVMDVNGNVIQPWATLAGKWLFTPDFMAGMDLGTNGPWGDIRCMFLESVTYTSPYSIQLQGGRADRVTQKLNQLGLGGI